MKTEAIVWNEITKRPMTLEEILDYEERVDESVIWDKAYIYEPLPLDGESVLVYGKYFDVVQLEVFHNNDSGVYFGNYNVDEIKAWAKIPEGM